MLKVNVGVSRKVSRDYNSTGFSVNLEGEVCVGMDDPEAVVEKIKEFYDLAEESLAQQLERHEGESGLASRDEAPPQGGRERSAPEERRRYDGDGRSPRPAENGNGRNGRSAGGDPATNKQIQFLLTLSKRQGMTKPQLENRIAGILEREVDLYDLSKRDAGVVLDTLTADGGSRSRRR
jgi:hypothetical protein